MKKFVFAVTLLSFTSMATIAVADASKKHEAIDTLLSNLNGVHAINIAGKELSTSVASFLTEALTEDGANVSGDCIDAADMSSANCIVGVDVKPVDGARKSYYFSFKKIGSKISGNTVQVVIAL